MKKFYVCILFPLVTLLAFMESANAQISIGSNGNIAIKTDNVHNQRGLNIVCNSSTNCGNTSLRYGVYSVTTQSVSAIGVFGAAHNAMNNSTGVRGNALGNSVNYGIHGYASNGSNNWAGYFSGNVFTSGSYSSSDQRFKKNIQSMPSGVLSKVMQLSPKR